MAPHDPGHGSASGRRAQAEPLAVILLVGLTVVGAGTIVVFGSQALDDSTASVDVGQAEHALTQLDSKASLVAHGASDTQRVRLTRNSRGDIAIDEDAGRMTVRIVNGTHGDETIMNESLGAVSYDRGRTTLAYQGGGVWRADGDGNGSAMVSPPEFHYRDGTLTLPLVRLRGDHVSGRSVRVTQAGPTDGRYPNATRSNPLTKGTVFVTVRSRYYRAWGTFFAERTSGNVSYDDANRTATIELRTPFESAFNNILATTDGGIDANGNGDPPSPSQTGVNYQSADSQVDNRIQDCLDGSCKSWSTTINDGGTYYTESDVKNDDIDVDTSNGAVELVVNGTFEPKTVDVSGTKNVTVFVKGDVEFGDANEGGDPSQFRVLVHSSGSVDMGGNAVFVGLLYAPGSEVDLNGKGEITGGIIGESVDINGNPANDFTHDPSVNEIDLGLGPGPPPVLYLHVSVTTVTVEDD
jgi:hypothetical protein